MSTRRQELVQTATRLFAERGYHGTSMGDIADAMGLQKGSLYSLTDSKQALLADAMRGGAAAFHAALDAVPDGVPALERIREALRGHLRVVAAQLEIATVFTREWRYLDDPDRARFLDERRRYEERWRTLLREGVERGELRTDLDVETATLLVLSAANWAYTWLTPGRDTDELADRFLAILVDGIRGYATSG
jgi:AcrR family transcriptional regulator